MAEIQTPILTVSQITQHIKRTLEDTFPLVAVEGELSNVRPSSAGHIYCTLKDDHASVSAVLFRGRASALGFVPQDGQQVVVHGNVGVYPPRGTYQIIVERMELAGEGRILAMLEARKRQLASEGLFDESRKRPLPLLPRRVAVVTSPTGAAIRDIMQVLRRRNSGLSVVVCPAAVQGDNAAAQIARMIQIAGRHELADVIIVTRGGGSLEDLLPFSDAVVVRSVAESSLPVISAVGHEIDWALSDFAADVRAPTPSAAAELVSANREELANRVRALGNTLVSTFLSRHHQAQLLVERFSPEELHRSYRLLVQPLVQRFDQASESLKTSIGERLRATRHRLQLASQTLHSLSPYDVLARGYSVARTIDGKILTNSRSVAVGESIRVQLAHGSLTGRIEETDHEQF